MEIGITDVEDETILSTIFKETFSDNLQGNPDFGHYLAELSSYRVERLGREPDRLAEERAQILEQTQDLAFHNYKTFIQTADCCKEIFQDFQIIEKHLDSTLSKLPELTKACEACMKQAHEINISRRTNNMTLQKHAQLLEILEMPQLMDTCVRNGYYDEALELATYVSRLEKKHAATIPIIANIVAEVKASTQLMLNQLVHQLRSNIQLPACLRVIGYLRRMDVFCETELRIKFLQARDAWFQNVLASIPGDDPYSHINKTIEASRVHLFDIITQYRAIFVDDDIILSSANAQSTDSMLFHGWVIQKVTQFLRILERDLDLGVGGRLDSVLGQCMYFGLSFSRVGADFRGLLAPIFQRAALSGFVKSVDEANQRFEELMQSYTILTTTSVPSTALYYMSNQPGSALQPPSVLLEFNPLAVYCNAVLNAFNDLRLCAPLALAHDVAQKLETSLKAVSRLIIAYHRVDEDSLTTQEQERFCVLCSAFSRELVPYLNKCLTVLFPPAQLATVLGVSVNELAKMGNMGVIDVEAVVEPLHQFIPIATNVIDPADNNTALSHEDTLSKPVIELDPSNVVGVDSKATATSDTTRASDDTTSADVPVQLQTNTLEQLVESDPRTDESVSALSTSATDALSEKPVEQSTQ